MAEQSEKKTLRKYKFYENQLHKPKYTAPDDNKYVSFGIKDHGATMILGVLKGIEATSLAMYIENYFKKHNSKLNVGFVFPKNVNPNRKQ